MTSQTDAVCASLCPAEHWVLTTVTSMFTVHSGRQSVKQAFELIMQIQALRAWDGTSGVF